MNNLLTFVAVVLIGSFVTTTVDSLLGVKFDKYAWWQSMGHNLVRVLLGAALYWAVTL